MAKKSMKARELKRMQTVAKYAAKRAELKEAIRNPQASYEDRAAAVAQVPQQAARSRHARRCPGPGQGQLVSAARYRESRIQ